MAIQQLPQPKGGIPTGNTAGRPSSPVIGDVYYNGQKAILEIYDGTNWVPCSAPAATPTISVADVGTSRAYGSAQGLITITPGTSGGPADSYIITASTGGYTATTTGTTVNITVGNSGSYTFSGQGVNNFGTSIAGPTTSATLTTVPEAPTIGTATASTSANQITVTWTLNNNGGKNLTAITVTPYLNGTTAQTATTAATTTSTSATITNLTGGSSYTFKVKATNANGDSLESSASNSATFPNIILIDYLVVAGGASGGKGLGSYREGGGGGGAGGMRCTVTATGGGGSLESALAVAASTNYTVTVGAGGAARTTTTQGANGSNSVFSTITSTGGGGGGTADGAGATGGSGGGAGPQVGSEGSGTANQGYAGGDGYIGNAAGGGGGGGAGAVGANGKATSPYGGDGGNGVATSISGSSVTYAGGGGGGSYAGTSAGGSGGGGGGANELSTGGSGTANTGSGGGGSGYGNSGAGGSGVVILRYSDAKTITIGAGLTGTESSASGGYKRATFTAGSGNVSWS